MVLLYGSGISDSNRHDPDNLPLLVVGGLIKGRPPSPLRERAGREPARHASRQARRPRAEIADSRGGLALDTLSVS